MVWLSNLAVARLVSVPVQSENKSLPEASEWFALLSTLQCDEFSGFNLQLFLEVFFSNEWMHLYIIILLSYFSLLFLLSGSLLLV
jgi:hypothetical protein